jgi:hypothetical protein
MDIWWTCGGQKIDWWTPGGQQKFSGEKFKKFPIVHLKQNNKKAYYYSASCC